MDRFMEEVVQKRNTGAQTALYVLANIVMVLAALMAFIALQSIMLVGFDVLALVEIVLFGGIAALLFLKRDTLRTEYEYTFTNGSLDFAQVFNNRKRKNLGTMNVRNVEAFGKVSSGSFQRYITMQGVKRSNWFLNRDAELYYFFFAKDGAKRVIVLEPSEELVENIKFYLPRGVYQVN